MDLSDDKRKVRLSISQDFSADELQTLISDLAAMRANMLPEVSSAPSQQDLEQAQRAGGFAVRTLSNEYVHLLFRDLGFGWLSLALDIGQACDLRDILSNNLPRNQPSQLLDGKIPNGDLPQ